MDQATGDASRQQERVVRVFISSTFRDMHAERDHLVKVVFPQLRRLCESRGVTWGEVDLRWGVTDEAAADGQVLPICLQEIERCRPYFIGLLGERYGWVPQSISAALLERETWLREQCADRKSVTELEILHGVLRKPAMAGHAFFYFRDPAYLQKLPPGAVPGDFVSEDASSAGKLRQLKQLIRESSMPVRDNYSTPMALGGLVLADLTAVINQRWPEGSQPDPLDREAMDHDAYARSRERVYIGRPEYFVRLDAHAEGGGDQPLVILGESGSGKSALLANWTARYRRAHPDALVLEHHIGATPSGADWAALLRRIMGEFKRQLGFQQDIPDKPDALRSAFPNWLHMAAASLTPDPSPSGKKGATTPPAGHSRILLLLDALNQLEDCEGARELLWLPPVMPTNVRLIVSTLPGKPLDEIRKRGWPVLQVEPLALDERRELVRTFLGEYGRQLSPARVERLAAEPQSANPLYLRVLLDELRLFGIHERLDERIGHYMQAASPYELHGRVITRWEQDYGGGTKLVSDTLTFLWAARRGLSEAELLDALGHDGQPLPRAVWSPLFLAMAEALVSRGGLLTFAHDFLRTAARDAYVPTDAHQRRAHERLADYFQRQPAGPRRTDELPWQLAEAHAWQRLYDLLADQVFFTGAWERNQFEVKTCWKQIEAGSPLRLANAYRAAVEDPENESDKGHLRILSHLLAAMGHPEEALRLRAALVEQFRATGDMKNLARSLGNQAMTLKARGDLDGAMALLKEEERICRQLGDSEGLQRSLHNQANIFSERGDLDTAMALHKDEERICRQSGDLDGLQGALNDQALDLHTRGDWDGAMALFKESERICRQLGNLEVLATCLSNQGLMMDARGDWDGAMALLKESERICRQLGDLAILATCLGNQGSTLGARGDWDRAMALQKEAEQISRKVGYPVPLARSLANQAELLSQRGKAREGLPLAEEAYRLAAGHGHTALARQIVPILEAIRHAAQEE
jgi:nephrocystin-3